MQFDKESLQNCATIVTVNRRLANFLREQFDLQQQLQGKTVWLSPDILPWDAWLQRCWQACPDSRMLLNELQAQWLWQQIIFSSSQNILLGNGLTQLAMEAWQYLQQWQISLDSLNQFAAQQDVLVFKEWASSYQTKLSAANWLDKNQIIQALLSHIPVMAWPKNIYFHGFMELSPAQKTLLAALKTKKVNIHLQPTSDESKTGNVIAGFNNPKQQWTSMARWAKNILQENASASIGCIVPNLHHVRDEIEQTFTAVFTEVQPFNITIGKNLFSYEMIAHACHFLQWLIASKLAYHEVSEFLLSPFLPHAMQELSARANLDKMLREADKMSLSIREILALSKKVNSNHYCPVLTHHLEQLLALQKQLPEKQLPGNWSADLQKILHALGWPGTRSLSSSEYQLLQRWQELLFELSALDVILHEVDVQTAVKILTTTAMQIIFQPQSVEKPIQILGLLEANSLQFDAIWISDVDEKNFPPQKMPNPFLPLSLQRQLKMPHADPKIPMEFYEKLLRAITCETDHCYFSYVKQSDAGAVNVSALLQQQPQITLDQVKMASYQDYSEWFFTQRQLETVHDDYGKINLLAVKKGLQILKNQATCPFKAFAEYHLAAEKLFQPLLGLDPRDRGVILHQILETIWRVLKEKTNLVKLNPTDLAALVGESIDAALLNFIPKKPHKFAENFTKLEKKRLMQLLIKWLDLESQRSDFKVFAIEQEQNVQLGALQFTIRMDRIDQFSDGRFGIIDYKSGKIAAKNVFGDRIIEPQLAVYFLATDLPIHALALAQLTPADMKFNGIACSDELLPNIKNKPEKFVWSELKSKWRLQFENLAAQFLQGYAVADPVNGKTTCDRCDLNTLCRFNNVYAQSHIAEDDDE